MEENRFYLENQEGDESDYIDVSRLLVKCMRIAGKLKYIGILVMVLGAIAGMIYANKSYKLCYDAYMTCSISDNFSLGQTTGNIDVADQMGKTFTYIVNSGVLFNVVANDLGVEAITSDVYAEPLSNTSMITIHVVDKDPNVAWKVLNSVMDNYHQVAEYIIGSTKLTPIDFSGVPTEPKYEINYLKKIVGGAIIGLGLFGVFVLALAIMYRSVDSPKGITTKIGVPLLAVIPNETSNKKNVEEDLVLTINKKTVSPFFVEGFRLLGNHLEKTADKVLDGGPVIMVTSTDSGEGKSTVAMNLSLLLAQRGHKVLLMDCDMHKPSLGRQMSIARMKKNIYSVLKGHCDMEDALGRNKKFPLHFLGEGRLEEETEGITLLSGENMRRLLEKASLEYEYVIIDTPPMSLFSDATVIAPLCDTAIYVVRNDYAPESDVLEQIGYLMETGVQLEGIVYNGALDATDGAYGYGYGYGYGRGAGYGYGRGRYSYLGFKKNNYQSMGDYAGAYMYGQRYFSQPKDEQMQ